MTRNMPRLIDVTQGKQLLIQRFQFRGFRHGHPMVAPEVANFPFYPAFFVALSGRAKLALESPVRPKRDELRRLLPAVAAKNLLHCTLQIVVTQDFEDTAKESKCLFVGFQKRLLGCARIGAVKCRPTHHAAHGKYLKLPPLLGEIRVSFIPVDLRLDAPTVSLRNEHILMLPSKFRLSSTNVSSDAGLGYRMVRHLFLQSRIDAMGGVPLLSWLLSVRDQNLVDKLYRRPYRWARPLCFSFWFRDRVGQRFPH